MATPTQNKKETLVVTADELEDFTVLAAPGDTCVYHRGHLSIEIDQDASNLEREDRRRLTKLAGRAYALARTGHLLLVQRREGDAFAYRATRSQRYQNSPEQNGNGVDLHGLCTVEAA